MAIKLTVTRHVEKKKRPPTKLVVERVTSKTSLAKKSVAKKRTLTKSSSAKKTKVAKVAKKTVIRDSKKKPSPRVKTVKPVALDKKAIVPSQKNVLDIGSPLPPFAMLSTNGGTLSLDELLGTRFVLYFYPKDETSGCTTEAHEFSKLAAEFSLQGVAIYGVSPDSLESHEHFIAKEQIAFPLLVDEGHAFAKACGVWGGLFNKRTTFVVGPDGIIERIYRDVKPEGHGVCVLEDLSK